MKTFDRAHIEERIEIQNAGKEMMKKQTEEAERK